MRYSHIHNHIVKYIILIFSIILVTLCAMFALQVNTLRREHESEIESIKKTLSMRIDDLESEIHARESIIKDVESRAQRKSTEIVQLNATLKSLESQILEEESIFEYLGESYVTAYCGCKKCCGKWGENRPRINNKEVSLTASGSIAEQGITIAVDPKVIPYGTKVYIEGVGIRVAQDCGGAIDGTDIDVYFEKHEDAWNSNLNDYLRKVWIIQE